MALQTLLRGGYPFQKNNAALATGTDTIDFTAKQGPNANLPPPGWTIEVMLFSVGGDTSISFDGGNTFFTQTAGAVPLKLTIRTLKIMIKGAAAGSGYQLLCTTEGQSSFNPGATQ